MTATPMTIDFSRVPEHEQHATGFNQDPEPDEVPISAEGKMLTPKQIRARARRRASRRLKRDEIMTPQEMEYLYKKPIDEWDLDELAAGRPRDREGRLSGRKPAWITTQVHEEAMTRYTAAIKAGMRGSTVDALRVIDMILSDDERDEKGKPIVPAGTKLEAAKFLIEHAIGKPKQQVESEVSVKLQGILGTVIVNPDQAGGVTPAHYPGITMALGSADDNTDGDDDYVFDAEPG
jgi:hypothetical protein